MDDRPQMAPGPWFAHPYSKLYGEREGVCDVPMNLNLVKK